MNLYESAQDYLERILILKKKNNKVRSIDIAIDMNYTKQSISRAMKILKENDFIIIDSNGYINLTIKGNEIATKIYDRHTTLTDYFVSIGVSKSIALHDACKIEHDISDETFHAIKNLLNKES